MRRFQIEWFAVGLAVLMSGCGHGISTPFEGQTDKPFVDPGGSYTDDTPCQPAPTPSVTPSPTPTPSSSPTPSPKPPEGFGCDVFPWLWWCSTQRSAYLRPRCIDPQNPPAHNTNYCQVDSSGKIISTDIINIQDGDVIHSVGGGCVARPVREVWAVILNHDYMKPTKVDEYHPSARNDLIDHSKGIYFVFDIENIVHPFPAINPSWTVEWFHAISHGDYKNPRQIAINYQKIEGTSYIQVLRGGYIIDRVTENITSFVMGEDTKADHTGADDVRQATETDLGKVRNGPPNWAALPDSPPGIE